MIALYIVLGIIGLGLIWIIADIIIALTKKPLTDLPKKFLNPGGLSLVYHFLSQKDTIPEGLEIDEKYIIESLSPSIEYINGRYDCADFRCQLLFRLYKDCYNDLSQKVRDLIKKTFLDFKYNMDEKGDDSMCYWSENHQLLFAVSEFLAGQEWPNEIFTNSGMTGTQHQEKALKIINIWMEQKFKYGFFEWYSNNYYAEDIAPMSNYIEYSKDAPSVERMKIIFDLLWFDVATHSVNNTFVPVSSRMYGDNKSSDLYGNRIKSAMQTIWDSVDTNKLVNKKSSIEQQIIDGGMDVATTVKLVGVDSQMMQNFISMYRKGFYKVPDIIKNIALDKQNTIIKASSGLEPEELKEENLIGNNTNQIMAQFGSETFTNCQVVQNTLDFLNKNKMFRNIFVNPFRFVNIKLLRLLKVPQLLSRKCNLMTNGIALGRGNVYCYRTKYYTLTTAMANGVDVCGAQGHIWSANISPDLAVYTTHPARDDDSKEKHGASPGYWVGNGRQPMSVQDENINITIYKLPQKKRLLEFYISNITHAYMPKEKFDILEIEENYIFAKKGNVLLAMITNGKPKYRPYDSYAAALFAQHDKLVDKIEGIQLGKEFDLVMEGGQYHAYITELSDIDNENYQDFKKRIMSNKVELNAGSVKYNSRDKELFVSYDKTFKINGKEQDMEYKRFESKYATTERKSDTINIEYNNKVWHLDYKNNIRKEIEEK